MMREAESLAAGLAELEALGRDLAASPAALTPQQAQRMNALIAAIGHRLAQPAAPHGSPADCETALLRQRYRSVLLPIRDALLRLHDYLYGRQAQLQAATARAAAARSWSARLRDTY